MERPLIGVSLCRSHGDEICVKPLFVSQWSCSTVKELTNVCTSLQSVVKRLGPDFLNYCANVK